AADGAGDIGPEASDANAPADVGSDARVCPSVADTCRDGGTLTSGPCILSWSEAQQASTWCSRFPNERLVIVGCAEYDVVVVSATDTSTYYYYDPQTGALVAIEGHGALRGPTCIAG